MNAKTLDLEQYTRDRRRLNTRLGLLMVVLIPLSFKGVKLIPNKVDAILKKQLLIYGVGGTILPFIGIKLIDMLISPWINL